MLPSREVRVICRSGDDSGVEIGTVRATPDATLEAFRAMCIAEALPLPDQCAFLSLQGHEVTGPEEQTQRLEQMIDAKTQAVWVQAARAPAAGGVPPPAPRADPGVARPLDIGTRSIQIPKTAEGLGMTLRDCPDTGGVIVATVQEAKAAWTAGVRGGDSVLLVEGHPLDSVDRLAEYVSEAEGVVRMEVSAREWQVGRASQPPPGLAAPSPPLLGPGHTPNGTSPGRGKLPSSEAMFSPPPQLSPQLPQGEPSSRSPGKPASHRDGRNGRSSPPPPPPPTPQRSNSSPLPPTPNPTSASGGGGGGAGAVPALGAHDASCGAGAGTPSAGALPAVRRAPPHSRGGAALRPEELALLPKVRVRVRVRVGVRVRVRVRPCYPRCAPAVILAPTSTPTATPTLTFTLTPTSTWPLLPKVRVMSVAEGGGSGGGSDGGALTLALP